MQTLETRQLIAFTELARLGSFTEAANQLGLTQSAVSHSIKALETQLEVGLFERFGKNVSLTLEGQALLPYANKIITQMQIAQDGIQILKKPGYGRLRIGATVSISQYLLPSILREFRESFPNYTITVVTEDTKKLVSMLENGKIDFAIALETSTSSRFKFTNLFNDQIEMAISPVHSIAKKDNINRDDIANEEFIFYKSTSETFHIIEGIFAHMTSKMNASMQVGSMAAIKEMAQYGMGIGLIPRWIALDEISSGTLIFRPLPTQNANLSWGIYEVKNESMSISRMIFSGICRNVVETRKLRTEILSERNMEFKDYSKISSSF